VRRTAEQIAELVRTRIERGLMVPGQRISQREVAELCATSTTPVREAFQVLVAQGFVRIDPHRGAVVARPSPEQIREIYEIRKALESLAVTEAIAHLDAAAQAGLQRLTREMRAARSSAERVELNRQFHAELYEAARMPRLAELIAQLRSAVSYYVERAYQEADVTEQAAADHEAILAACRRGDREGAAAALVSHLEESAVAAVASAERLDELGSMAL
jgi:DNA-binding GntR family transcriptional regulator